MFDHAGRAAEIVGGWHHVPALAGAVVRNPSTWEPSPILSNKVLAAMDHEIAQACAVVGEAVGFVKNPGQEYLCHLSFLF
jgi:hypothetical protein